MSAETLRRAAKVLREHAEKATAGPWRAVPYVYGKPEDGHSEPRNFEVYADDRAVVSHQPHEGGGAGKRDAEYIALMAPPVALALAILFGEVAESLEQEGDFVQDSTTAAALAVARAILREAP